MSDTNTVRNDIKQLAQHIESLAKEVQVKADQGGDLIMVANELVRNSSTFVFTLGELYGLENGNKSVKKVTTVKNGAYSYHNVRDRLGRFSKV